MKKILIWLLLLLCNTRAYNQITDPNGGDSCNIAISFSSTFFAGCPASPGQNFITSNLSPTLNGPASTCGNNSGYDQWFKFTASLDTAVILVNPQSSLNVAIEIFSGTCNNLTSIACRNAAGNNQPETLIVRNLIIGTTYYFRIFGQSSSTQNQRGTYDFCGTTGGIIPNTGLSIVNILSYKDNYIYYTIPYTFYYIDILQSDNNITFTSVDKIYNGLLNKWYIYPNSKYYKFHIYTISGEIIETNTIELPVSLQYTIQEDYIHIKNIITPYTIRISDILGNIKYTNTTNTNTIIPFNFSAGTYIISIQHEDKITHIKIVK